MIDFQNSELIKSSLFFSAKIRELFCIFHNIGRIKKAVERTW